MLKYITNQRIFGNINDFNISNIIFKQCTNINDGGAIYCESSINIFLNFVTFLLCSTNSRGGGIATRYPNQLIMFEICFINCSAYFCPGFSLDGYSYISNKGTINFSSYSCPHIAYHASQICPKYTLVNNFNISNCNTNNNYSPNIFIGSSNSEPIFIYSQISNSNGVTFFCFQVLTHLCSPIIQKSNFINNSISIAWFEIHRVSTNPIINNSFFTGNYNYPIFHYTFSTTGTATFLNCLFSFNYNPIFNINTIQNNFNILNDQILKIQFINNYYCLFNQTLFSQKSKIFKFKYYFFLMNFLNK